MFDLPVVTIRLLLLEKINIEYNSQKYQKELINNSFLYIINMVIV